MSNDRPPEPETADGQPYQYVSCAEYFRSIAMNKHLETWSRIKARKALFLLYLSFLMREFALFLLFWGLALWIAWLFLPWVPLRIVIGLAGLAMARWRFKKVITSWRTPTMRLPVKWDDVSS
jgi:hypothetical protein